MKNSLVLLSALIALLHLSNGRASFGAEPVSSDPLARGISLYDKKNYAEAQEFLAKAVAGPHKNAAVAHYYYANALMQLRKTNAALDEYERCYCLAPFSSFSGYCRMMLLRHGRKPDEKLETKAAGNPSEKSVPPAAAPTAKANSEAPPPATAEKSVIDEEVKQMKGRLPRLISITKETPLALDVMADSVYVRSAYVGEAEQRKSRAFDKLEQSRQNLKHAEAITHSFVPSVKSFGEADEEFRSRRAKAEETVTSLLEPFKENVNEAEKVFQSESSLLENCINARNGYGYH